jgi:hypothetical protein
MVLPVPSLTVSEAYDALLGQGRNTKGCFQNLLASIQSGDQDATIDSQVFLVGIQSAVNTLSKAQQLTADTSQSAALTAYVQQMAGDPSLDVSAELTASMTALGAAIMAMVGDYPKDANGFLLDRSFSQSGELTSATLSPASLSNSATAMTAWLATIS